MAGRVVRDTDATTLPSIDLEAVKGKIQDVGTQISDTVAKIFTQENLDVSCIFFMKILNKIDWNRLLYLMNNVTTLMLILYIYSTNNYRNCGLVFKMPVKKSVKSHKRLVKILRIKLMSLQKKLRLSNKLSKYSIEFLPKFIFFYLLFLFLFLPSFNK